MSLFCRCDQSQNAHSQLACGCGQADKTAGGASDPHYD
ncbi:hypothetical protein M3J09_001076 [Ascochyta lentis]